MLRGNYSERIKYDNMEINMPRYDHVDLILLFNEKRQFKIRFKGDSYFEEKGIECKVNIKAWDDTKLD